MRKYYILFVILVSIEVQATWVDTKYSDFQKGTYDAAIYVSRRLQTESNPGDSGCIEYHARFDVNNDGWYDLLSADDKGPNLRIWLGSSSGYSAVNCLTYPISSGGSCDISDLNLDGYPELIHCGYDMDNLCIYWGTAAGPSTTNTTLLPNNGSEAIYVADFDKDTYLDIVVPGPEQHLYIYWGNDYIYSVSNRLDVSAFSMKFHVESADLDKNGYLDLGVIYYNFGIFYQDSARHFAPMQSLNFSNTDAYPHGLSVEDLNGDGYIDIVATGTCQIDFSSIYWGSSSGYSDSDKLTINSGASYGGSAIADFNDDNLPDIIYFSGGGWVGGTGLPIIYYNSGATPYFSNTNTQSIGMAVSASGGMAADFNKDGELDVFVNCLGSYSYIFYGPGFTFYDSLPVVDDHHGTFREPRQLPPYYSRVVMPCTLGVDTVIESGTASWIANLLGNSKASIYVRSGNTQTPDSNWTDWYEVAVNPGSLPGQVLRKKYIQYRANLWWENPAELPNVEQVSIACNCGAGGIEETTIKRENVYIKTNHKKLIINTVKAVEIDIYDISGTRINSFSLKSGTFEIELKNSGIYWVKDRKTGFTKKAVLL